MVWSERLSRGRHASSGTSTSGHYVGMLEPDEDENIIFNEKLASFDQAEQAFKTLTEKLEAYKQSYMTTMKIGVELAEHVENFFKPPAATTTQRELAVQFRMALKNGQDRWKKRNEKIFDEDVYMPVKGRLDEIPEVRDYIKKRGTALSDWQRRQKKLAAVIGKKDRRQEERRRKKCEEAAILYRSAHDEVIQRCTNIERNLGNFISPSLRSLVSICADHSTFQSKALSDVEHMLNAQPPMTPCLLDDDIRVRSHINEPNPGSKDAEVWDNAFSGENIDDAFSGVEVGSAALKSTLVPLQPVKSFADLNGTSVSDSASQHHHRNSSGSSTNTTGKGMISDSNLDESRNVVGSASRQDISTLAASADNNGMTGNVVSSLGRRPVTHSSMDTSAGSSSSMDLGANRSSWQLAPNASGSIVTGSVSSRRKPSDDTSISELTDEHSQKSVGESVLTYRVAEFDFSPSERNEMKILKGEVIEVLRKSPSGWWHGRCKEHCGLFPENYTRPMSEQEEIKYTGMKQKHQRQRSMYRRGMLRGNSRESYQSSLASEGSRSARQSAAAL